jgi:hypothetical protein
MQLHLEFVQNIQEDQVRGYVETSNEEIFEHNHLILLGIWSRLHARWSGKSFEKVSSETLQR